MRGINISGRGNVPLRDMIVHNDEYCCIEGPTYEVCVVTSVIHSFYTIITLGNNCYILPVHDGENLCIEGYIIC